MPRSSRLKRWTNGFSHRTGPSYTYRTELEPAMLLFGVILADTWLYYPCNVRVLRKLPDEELGASNNYTVVVSRCSGAGCAEGADSPRKGTGKEETPFASPSKQVVGGTSQDGRTSGLPCFICAGKSSLQTVAKETADVNWPKAGSANGFKA
ncbi:predicted protein [Chaetomium globosum CBS 148.51]|uniref:Uncharacterized protein n=1 Tax=Chaetomium globosum (strain ATCC 6205 / CBS 148.51 / DSM 1962 / NBRC 6347 / NRRL 1970) TaxID=306901 RepID=Q2H3U4_CHAGB|nr:uncharacterized protein CHGG_06671 [Chaetomium globosum CBS 148.51]EAQ90052.1 predicted protein [Chaetomium globosum CBS 148.51]